MRLVDHLDSYGIKHFTDDSYWTWGAENLGEKRTKHLNKLRKPMVAGRAKRSDMYMFYEYIANPEVAGIVHSLKADAVRASGEAVIENIGDPNTILDLGCNIGYLTTWYAAERPSSAVVGVDISLGSIETAKKIAKHRGYQNISFVGGDPKKLLAGKRYGVVIDTQTLLDADDPALLSWVVCALEDQGKYVGVLQATSAQILQDHCQRLVSAGLQLSKLEKVMFSDLGEPGAYSLVVATKGCEVSIDPDYEAFFAEMEDVVHRRRADSITTSFR